MNGGGTLKDAAYAVTRTCLLRRCNMLTGKHFQRIVTIYSAKKNYDGHKSVIDTECKQ